MGMDNQGLLIAGEHILGFPRFQRTGSGRTYPAFTPGLTSSACMVVLLGVKAGYVRPPSSLASTAYFSK